MTPDLFPLPDAELLAAFNDRWRRAASAYARHAPPPWWGPGLLIDRHLRHALNRFIPIEDYLGDLRWLLARALPHVAWVPRVVTEVPPSIADLWKELPGPYQGRVAWEASELLPLACALASPPRFGTAAGRYPEQWPLLAGRLAGNARWRVLDVACGTGQGTWELAGQLAGAGIDAQVLGLTREPLEAWMAARRCLPYFGDGPPAEWAFPEAAPAPRFAAGDLLRLPARAPFEVVVCNGLLGGPALHEEAPLRAAVGELARLLPSGGLLLIGNRFHDGRQGHLAHLQLLLRDAFDLSESAAPSQLWTRR